jgi:competence protein ComEA
VIQPLKKLFDYFYLTRRQRKGMVLLFILLALLAAAYVAVPFYFTHQTQADDAFLKEVQSYLSASVKKSEPKTLTPFSFDPNTITRQQLLQIGLSEYQASMIVKYRNAGGKFYRNEDFGKIYSITDEEYLTLEPFIVISKPGLKEVAEEKKTKPVYQPAPFDPNLIDSVEMASMGFGRSQINNILNYRKAGGKFRVKQDFKKLYTINDELYEVFEKNILLPSVDTTNLIMPEDEPQPLAIVEINSADTAQLQALKGIGPVLAKRIIDYRQKLGGFYDKSQLLEVFGIDTIRFQQFSKQIIIDKSKIIKRDINTVQFSELLNNPYIEFYIVQSIFNYRDAIGKFDSIGQLREIDLIYDQLFKKLEPYLVVQHLEN